MLFASNLDMLLLQQLVAVQLMEPFPSISLMMMLDVWELRQVWMLVHMWTQMTVDLVKDSGLPVLQEGQEQVL